MRRNKNILIVTDPRIIGPWAFESMGALEKSLISRGWSDDEISEFLEGSEEIFEARKIAKLSDIESLYSCEDGSEYLVFISGLCVQITE